MICLGQYTVAASVATAVAGWMTPAAVKTYVTINADPWDNNKQIDFEEPMGSLGIEYDIHKHAKLFAEHISSPIINHVDPIVDKYKVSGEKAIHPISTTAPTFHILQMFCFVKSLSKMFLHQINVFWTT